MRAIRTSMRTQWGTKRSKGNRPPFPCFLSPRSARCFPCPKTGEKGGADVEEIGSRADI